MDILKKHFDGEEKLSYDELKTKMGDTKILVNDGTYIPKSRFDEVNTAKSDLEAKVKELETKNMTEEQKMQKMVEDLEQSKSQYAKEMSKLKAEQVFVKAGLSEEEYSKLLPRVVNENQEETISAAKDLVDIISAKTEALKSEYEKKMLDSQTDPKTNKKGQKINNPFAKDSENVTEQMRLYREDRNKYNELKTLAETQAAQSEKGGQSEQNE